MLTRSSFVEKAEKIFAEESYEQQAFLYYFDFADFKLVNRYYGLKGGDELLVAMEAYLSHLPQVVAYERVFSDYFVFLVLIPEPYNDKDVVARFTRFSEGFLAQCKDRYRACNLRMYCGISAVKTGNVKEAMDKANIAWHIAKKSRVPNAVVFEDMMLEEAAQRQILEQEINIALREEQFTFFLQPRVELETGRITSAEALARRFGLDGSIIYPDKSLSIMEENGLVVELDRFVLRKVCEYISRRIKAGLPVVRTSVNLSRLHIQVPDAAEKLHSIVQEYEVPREYLEFELTETIFMEQFAGARELCSRLRGLGYRMAIDDFGSGYAGIDVLRELEFAILKLDRKFLEEEEPMRGRNRAILPDIIRTLNKLNIIPLCEGVETLEQCYYLASLGCKHVQGFYFSRPVPPEQFYETYERQNGHYPVPPYKEVLYGQGSLGRELDISLENLLASIINDIHDGIYYVNRERKIRLWNRAAEQITGYEAQEVVGRHCWSCGLDHIDRQGRELCNGACPLTNTMADGTRRREYVYARHKNGGRVPLLVETFPVESSGEIVGAIELFMRCTPRMYADDRMEERTGDVIYDASTMLPNRKYLESFLDFKLDEYKRQGRLFTVLAADIDDFGCLKKQFGGRLSERILLKIGSAWGRNIRQEDLAGCWDGEQLVGVFAVSSEEDARPIADKFLRLVADTPVTYHGKTLHVTASAGVTTVRRGDTVQTVVARAQQLLQRGKEKGGGHASVG